MIEQGFSREDVYAVKANLVELFMIVGVFLLLKALGTGDDDDEQTAFEKYIIRTGNRTLSELSFFMWPGSAMQILISPAAAVSSLQDLGKLISHTTNEIYGNIKGDNELTERAKPMRQVRKLFPIVNQVQRIEENLFEEAE
jgi:hypothetical protein